MNLRQAGALDQVSIYQLSWWKDGTIGYYCWYLSDDGNKLCEGVFERFAESYQVATRVIAYLLEHQTLSWSKNLDPCRFPFETLGQTVEFSLNAEGDLECKLSDLEDERLYWNTRQSNLKESIHKTLFSDIEFLIRQSLARTSFTRQCSTCSANWSLGEHDIEKNCLECGSFAREKECSECEHSCGKKVIRDVRTSNNNKRAEWFGGCKTARLPQAWTGDPWIADVFASLLMSLNSGTETAKSSTLFDKYSGLLLSVGSNPLPAYQVIARLRPPRLAIISQSATTAVLDGLLNQLKKCYSPEIFHFDSQPFLQIMEPHDMQAVRNQLEPVMPVFKDYVLCYSGGSKALLRELVTLYQANAKQNGLECHLGADGILRFDNGESLQAFQPMSVEEMAVLHGCSLKKSGLTIEELRGKSPGVKQADQFFSIADKDFSILQTVRAVTSKNIAKNIDELVQLTSTYQAQPSTQLLGSILMLTKKLDELEVESKKDIANSIATLGALFPQMLEFPVDSSQETLREWIGFVRGDWLEFLVADMVSRATPNDEQHQTCIGVEVENLNSERTFEIDVVHMYKGKGFLVSCTTDPKLAKHKLFEIAARAQQLCGKFARPALVVLADSKKIAILKQDLGKDWIGTRQPPYIFGLDDLRIWQTGDLSSLNTWITK